MLKCRVFSDPYFPVFNPNFETPYLDTFHALMSIEDLACYKPKTMHTNRCYFDTLVAAKHAGLTCHDDLMLVLEYVEDQTTFSVRSKNACMIACNINLAVELVSLESFECTHKEVFFRMQLEEEK